MTVAKFNEEHEGFISGVFAPKMLSQSTVQELEKAYFSSEEEFIKMCDSIRVGSGVGLYGKLKKYDK